MAAPLKEYHGNLFNDALGDVTSFSVDKHLAALDQRHPILLRETAERQRTAHRIDAARKSDRAFFPLTVFSAPSLLPVPPA